MLDSTSNVTFAPDGGSLSSACLTALAATCPSTPGGRRNDSLSVVKGRNTFPAFCNDGIPSTPVTDSVGRQLLLRSSSYGSSFIGGRPPAKGILVYTPLPRVFAAARACCRRSSGIRVHRASIS